MTQRIGVIGLGRMDAAIAQRMTAEGADVTGWTRSGRAVEGVRMASDLARVCAFSDTLVLSLYDDDAVAEVLDALLALDLSGRLIIETSTVVPDLLKTRIAAIQTAGGQAVDAPISGGPDLVAAGQCGVFIGGTDTAAKGAEQVLTLISDRIFHVGPLGAGLVMKTINNGMLEAYFNGLHDLMPLAARAGLKLETALKIVSGGPAGAPFLTARLPKILGEDDTVGFSITALQKDKEVFARIAAAYGLPAPTMDRFGKIVAEAIAAGDGTLDAARLVSRAYECGEKA